MPSITAEIEVKVLPELWAEEVVTYPVVLIEYSFLPGAAPIFNEVYGGDPGYPAEVDLISAKLIDGDGTVPTQQQITDWAFDWLHGDGFDMACREAKAAA